MGETLTKEGGRGGSWWLAEVVGVGCRELMNDEEEGWEGK